MRGIFILLDKKIVYNLKTDGQTFKLEIRCLKFTESLRVFAP